MTTTNEGGFSMKAGEFLKSLTNNPFIEYNGIYTSLEGRLVPFTTAKPDRENNLIFFRQNRKSPLSVKNLHSILLLHQNKTLYFWNGGSKIKIYRYIINDKKIIV